MLKNMQKKTKELTPAATKPDCDGNLDASVPESQARLIEEWINAGHAGGHEYSTILVAEFPSGKVQFTHCLQEKVTDHRSIIPQVVMEDRERLGGGPSVILSLTFTKHDQKECYCRSLLAGLQEMKWFSAGRNDVPTFHWDESLQIWWGSCFSQSLTRKEKQMLGSGSLSEIPWYSDEPELADATGTGEAG